MILGIGTDIAKVSRFFKWVKNPLILERFFAEEEQKKSGSEKSKTEHYAVRFAAKEAFSKALGTGISGFKLKDVFIQKNSQGKPFLITRGSAKEILENRFGKTVIHVSLSHEKEYALAFVVIESV